MRRILTALVLLAPLAASAQEEERGFFGRLFGSDEDGPGFLEGLLEDSLSGAGRQVDVVGFEGALSSRATIEELTIADDQGTWLTMRDLVLDWNRSAILRGNIDITELSAGEILLPRLPEAQPAGPEVPSAEAQGFSLPELPVAISIDAVQADRVVLGEPLFGEEAVVQVAGEVSLEGGAGAVDLAIERIDGEEGALTVEAAYSNESRELALSLDLVEGPDGIVANLIDLPGRPSLELAVEGDGPISDFSADIALSTAGQQRLAGNVTLTEVEAEDGQALRFAADLGGDIAPVFLPEYRDFFGTDVQLETAGTRFADGRLELETLALDAGALTLSGEVAIGADGLPDLVDIEGRIADASGEPVLLPLSGPETRVGDVTIDLAFDASESEDWDALIRLRNLDRQGFSAEALTLDGSGRIATEGDTRVVTAALDFTAEALDLGDPGASQALGEQVTGAAEIVWREGEPVQIDLLRIDGESYQLSAEATVDAAETGVTVDGRATLQAGDLSAFSGLVGRPLDGSAALSVEGEGDVLAGRFDLAIDGTTQDLSVGEERLDPLLAGTGTLTVRTARDETGTEIETLRVATDAATISAVGRLATGESRVVLDARVPEAGVLDPALSGPATLSATAEEGAEGWTFDVAADAPGADLAAQGRVTGLGENPVVTGSASLQAADLSDFSELAGRPLSGRIEATAEGRTGFDLQNAAIDLVASGQDLALGLPDIDPLLAGPVEIALNATREGGTVRIDGLRADGAALQATAEGVVEGLDATPVFTGQATVSADDLSRFAALAGRPLDGGASVEADGRLAFDLSRFDFAATATTIDLDPGLPGVPELLEGQTTLTVDASRDAAGVVIDAFRLDGQQVGAEVTGRLTGLDATPVFDGRAALRAADIAPLSDLAGRELSGAVEAEVSGTAAFDGSRFDLELDASAENLNAGLPGATGPLQGRTTLSASAQREGDVVTLARFALDGPSFAASADGTVSDLGGTPAFDGALDLTADDLSVFSDLAGRSLDGSLTASLDGQVSTDLATADLVVEATGRDLDFGLPGGAALLPGEATLAFEAAREDDRVVIRQLNLDSANLTASGGGVLTNLDATPVFDGELSLSADNLAPLAPLTGQNLRGSLQADASGQIATDLQRLDLQTSVVGRNLAVGLPEVDRLLGGTTTLDLDASRQGEDIVIREAQLDTAGLDVTASGRLSDAVTVAVRLADLSPYAPGLAGPLTVRGTASLADETIRIDLDADGPGSVGAQIDGAIATSFDDFNLDIIGQAPLVLANRTISPLTIEGLLNFDLALDGAPALQNISGTLSTSGARFVEPRFSLVLQDIDLDAQLGGAQVVLDGTAAVESGGQISVQGPIGLQGALPADLTVLLQNVRLIDPELYETRVEGQVTVDGPLRAGARIGGDLTLGRTELRIPAGGFGAAGQIPDIVHVNEPSAVRATRDRAGITRRNASDGGQRGPAFPLDITIRAPNQIFIRGRGLDAELGGQIQLLGTTRNIQPSGQFDLIRGRLDILGERLTLDEGFARLQGDFVPFVRLVAETDAGEITVFVIVEGSLREPDIDFQSAPDLPDDEILARLLFGRDISNISAFQAAQLANAVATLAGGGLDISGGLRESLGVDDFDITTDESGNAAFRAGKYLSDNVYTDVTVDSEGETQINLNYDLSRSVTVKGGVDSEGGTSLGVFFERDY